MSPWFDGIWHYILEWSSAICNLVVVREWIVINRRKYLKYPEWGPNKIVGSLRRIIPLPDLPGKFACRCTLVVGRQNCVRLRQTWGWTVGPKIGTAWLLVQWANDLCSERHTGPAAGNCMRAERQPMGAKDVGHGGSMMQGAECSQHVVENAKSVWVSIT